MTATTKWSMGLRAISSRMPHFLMQITRNSFALLGVAVACLLIAVMARPDLRDQGEGQLREWLQARQGPDAELEAVPAELDEPGERVVASDPKGLPKDQARVAHWLSKKYRVAPEPLSLLVGEAYELGTSAKLDPTLILAVMAIESRFNPFAQSPVGAQGLMQVMTRVHTDKYENFGGQLAAFDPVTNLRVGVQVLQECIRRAGSLEGGLRYYVGAANLTSDGGYAAKVLAEHFRIRQVAAGRSGQTSPGVPAAPVGTLTTKAETTPASPALGAVPAASPSPDQAAPGEKVAMLSPI